MKKKNTIAKWIKKLFDVLNYSHLIESRNDEIALSLYINTVHKIRGK